MKKIIVSIAFVVAGMAFTALQLWLENKVRSKLDAHDC